MKYISFDRIALLAIALVLAIIAIQDTYPHEELNRLENELELVNASVAVLTETLHSSPSAAMQAAIDDLYAQVSSNRQPVNTLSVHASKNPESEPLLAEVAGEQSSEIVTTVFEALKERGQIYASDWQEVSAELGSMSKDENRQFWQQMYAAIDSGEVVAVNE